MNLLIFVAILVFEISQNHGYVVPKVHRYSGSEAFEIREDSGSPVRITVPKAENNLTLREIIYYHLVEKPFDQVKENNGENNDDSIKKHDDEDCDENGPKPADIRHLSTNGHGFQPLDGFHDDKNVEVQNDTAAIEPEDSEDSSTSSEEIDEIRSDYIDSSSSEDEEGREEEVEENSGSTDKVLEEAEKRKSRSELFEQQKHRYESKIGRPKREIIQADIPPPPTLPPPLDYKNYQPVDDREKMLERSASRSFENEDDDTMRSIISSELSKMFGLDPESKSQINKLAKMFAFDPEEPQSSGEPEGHDEEKGFKGPSPRTYGVNLRNGEGYVWNGLWSNPPLMYQIGENAPKAEPETPEAEASNNSDEIVSELADLFSEIENLTDAENDDNSSGNDELADDEEPSDDDETLFDEETTANKDDTSLLGDVADDDVNEDSETVVNTDDSNNNSNNDESNRNVDSKKREKDTKDIKNDELSEDDGSYRPTGDDGSYKPSGDDGNYRPSEYETEGMDEPENKQNEHSKDDNIYDIDDIQVRPAIERNKKEHIKLPNTSTKEKQLSVNVAKNHNLNKAKGKSLIPNEESVEDKNSKDIKKDKDSKKDPKKGFFKGNFSLDKYDTSNNDDFDHLEAKYRVKQRPQAKKIDSLVEIMKDEQFWKWLAEWTSTYMEVLTKYIKKIAQEEIQNHINAWESKHEENIKPNNEEKDKKEHEKLKPLRDDEEDAIIIGGQKFPLTHNSNLDEIDEVAQYLRARKRQDGKKHPAAASNKKEKDENSNINKPDKERDVTPPAFDSNKKNKEDKVNKTASVDSAVIYGNSVNTDSVTNVFIFYPNSEIKQTQHSLHSAPHKEHIKPNKEAESGEIKDAKPKQPEKKETSETSTLKATETTKEPEANKQTTEVPKKDNEKETTTESSTKEEIKKDTIGNSAKDKETPEETTQPPTKSPEIKPSEESKQEIAENKDKENASEAPQPEEEKKEDVEPKKNADSEKIESKPETEVLDAKEDNSKPENNSKKSEREGSSPVKTDDGKKDTDSIKDKSDSTIQNGDKAKKDEDNSKKESLESKKDGVDSKKEDGVDSKTNVADSKKDDKVDALASKDKDIKENSADKKDTRR